MKKKKKYILYSEQQNHYFSQFLNPVKMLVFIIDKYLLNSSPLQFYSQS